MTPRAARFRCALWLGTLVTVALPPARAQVLRVVAGDRELARAEASTLFDHPALPITLLARLGADVKASRAEVVVRLFADTLRFRPGSARFQVNREQEALPSWTYQEDGVLFVTEWFFTRWLPNRYPGRLAYRDGVLRIVAAALPVAAQRPVQARDTARAAAAPRSVSAVPAARPDPDDPLRGVLLGFIDARVSGVFDSNVDRDPVPRPSYGGVARLGLGIQSARSRPFLTARYDLAVYRFANTADWNRATHDVGAELAPVLRPIRLRLGAAVRLGSLTEDRESADQVILRPQIEIRPTPTHVLSLYVAHSARRIEGVAVTRSDVFRLAGAGYYIWWRGGGMLVDGRYEANTSTLERSRYAGWTGHAWTQIPLPSSHRLALETEHNRRRYAGSFVDQAGTMARADERWTSSVSLTRALAARSWEVGVKYGFEDNRSNDAYAVYESHRVELTVRRRW